MEAKFLRMGNQAHHLAQTTQNKMCNVPNPNVIRWLAACHARIGICGRNLASPETEGHEAEVIAITLLPYTMPAASNVWWS